jgi:hypothetical protein
MEPPSAATPGRVTLALPGDLEPVYANFALISHSAQEMVIDLAQIMPQIPQAKVKVRLIMTPLNAKLLLRALDENLSRYESRFGTINVPEGSSLADQLFRPGTPEAPPGE